MDKIAMVEDIRRRANLNYEQAKALLEKADWDLLDALVILEKEGKIEAGS